MQDSHSQRSQKLQQLLAEVQNRLSSLEQKQVKEDDINRAERIVDQISQLVNCLEEETDEPQAKGRVEVESLDITCENSDLSDTFVLEIDGNAAKSKRLATIIQCLSSSQKQLSKLQPIDVSAAFFAEIMKPKKNQELIQYFGVDKARACDELLVGPQSRINNKEQDEVFFNTVSRKEATVTAFLINDMIPRFNNFELQQRQLPPVNQLYKYDHRIDDRYLLIEIKDSENPDRDLRVLSTSLTFDHTVEFSSDKIYDTVYNNLFLDVFRIGDSPCFLAFFLFKKRIQILNLTEMSRSIPRDSTTQSVGGYFDNQSVTFPEEHQIVKYELQADQIYFHNFSILTFHLSKQSSLKWNLTLVRRRYPNRLFSSPLQICSFSFGDNQAGQPRSIDSEKRTIQLKLDLSRFIYRADEVINFITRYNDLIIYTSYFDNKSYIYILYNQCMKEAKIEHKKATNKNENSSPINRIDVADIHGIIMLAVQDYDVELVYYYFFNGMIKKADTGLKS